MRRSFTRFHSFILNKVNISPHAQSDNTLLSKKNKTIALLFGWADGTQRQLLKYASIYHSLGIDTIIYTSSHRDVIFPATIESKMIDEVKSFQSKLHEINPNYTNTNDTNYKQEYIIHVFSNGGLWSLHHLLQHSTHLKNAVVTHFILDSCPSGLNLTPMAYVRGLTSSATNIFSKIIFGSIVYIGACIDILLQRMSLAYHTKSFVYTCMNVPIQYTNLLNAKVLYLYSDHDYVIAANDIIQHSKLVREKQLETYNPMSHIVATVELHNFRDSQHVLHYKKYPVEYTHVIHTFLSK